MALPIVTNNINQPIDAVPVYQVGAGGAGDPGLVTGPPSGVVAGTITRPADTNIYAIGDLIANSTTAGSVVPGTLAIGRTTDKPAIGRRLRLKVNDTAWKGATIRVHLFKDVPTVSVGDNGQLNNSETYAMSESSYLGYYDILLSQQFSVSPAMVKGFVTTDFIADPATGTANISFLLEARTAVTPISGAVFTLVCEALRD